MSHVQGPTCRAHAGLMQGPCRAHQGLTWGAMLHLCLASHAAEVPEAGVGTGAAWILQWIETGALQGAEAV